MCFQFIFHSNLFAIACNNKMLDWKQIRALVFWAFKLAITILLVVCTMLTLGDMRRHAETDEYRHDRYGRVKWVTFGVFSFVNLVEILATWAEDSPSLLLFVVFHILDLYMAASRFTPGNILSDTWFSVQLVTTGVVSTYTIILCGRRYRKKFPKVEQGINHTSAYISKIIKKIKH